MYSLNVDDEQSLNAELLTGEIILWSGKPNPRVIFHASDWGMIPFSLLWGGFTLFWEFGVSGAKWSGGKAPPSYFMMLWGSFFVVMGQYFIWGRFIYAAWKKTRIVYAVTSRRVLTVVRGPGSTSISAFLDGVSSVAKDVRNDGIGTIRFGETAPVFSACRGNKTQSMDGLYLK